MIPLRDNIRSRRYPLVNIALIAACVVVFVYQYLYQYLYLHVDQDTIYQYAFRPAYLASLGA
ncbi:unnamed protein product, partial [marine sediment metagenome]